MTTHESHYAAIVDAQKDVEVYQLGDAHCADCLRSMADKHAALAAAFSARLPQALPGDPPQALCHECSEMVVVLEGNKLEPHHGKTGDGCPQNDAAVQIWLHPLVADRIAFLEAELAFGSGREER